MKAGRKNLKRTTKDDDFSLQEGQSIMQVISLRGSNVIEVKDDKGMTNLAIFPAKFQKSFWIRRGSYVVVDETGREKALESGSKIACVVSQVLFHDQVRKLEKSPDWPSSFKNTGENKAPDERPECREEIETDDEDGIPLPEHNLNRNRPVEFYSDSESDNDS